MAAIYANEANSDTGAIFLTVKTVFLYVYFLDFSYVVSRYKWNYLQLISTKIVSLAICVRFRSSFC